MHVLPPLALGRYSVVEAQKKQEIWFGWIKEDVLTHLQQLKGILLTEEVQETSCWWWEMEVPRKEGRDERVRRFVT
jgi:hypothetical protein